MEQGKRKRAYDPETVHDPNFSNLTSSCRIFNAIALHLLRSSGRA